MVEPLPRSIPDDDLSADTSRLDGSLLRYVLLHRSRLNMLRLDRQIRALVDAQGVVALAPGSSRSDLALRAEATMQLAVEIALARPAVARWIGRDALRRQRATDAAYYASECWLGGNEPDQQPGEEFAWPPAGDRTKRAGLPLNSEAVLGTRFWVYLYERSRLQEEHVPVATESDPAIRPAAVDLTHLLADGERLQAIAADVIWILGEDMSRRLWRVCVEEACLDGRLRRPPPEVFDALLTGQDSLVRSTSLNGRPAWSLAPDGEPVLPDSRDTLRSAAALAQTRKHIDRWHSELSTHVVIGDSVLPFVLLSDRLGMIPTTPAWPDVDSALRSLSAADSQREQTPVRAQASAATPNQSLQTESRLVWLFGTLLKDHERQMGSALAAGAFLGALNEVDSFERGSTISTRRLGLELLAEGLRFRETASEEIADKLATLSREMATDSKSQDPRSELPDLYQFLEAGRPVVDQIGDAILRAEMNAQTWRHRGLRPVSNMAWEAARSRLVQFCRDGRVGDATLPELMCAARHEGPARWVTLDPRRMTLASWSRAWLASILEPEVPAWLGVIALQRLGVNSLRLAEQERLLRALKQVESAKPDSVHSAGIVGPRASGLVELSARGEGAWRRGGLGGGAAILLQSESGGVASSWQRSGARGIVLLFTVGELSQLCYQAPSQLLAMPRPCALLREEGAVDTRLFARLEARLRDIQLRVPLWRRALRWPAGAVSSATGETGIVSGIAGPDELFGSAVTDEMVG